jgi:hypothetical protein
MMKKLKYMLLALLLLSACGDDFAEMDIGLDGNWITQNGEELHINGMGFTRTAENGDIETGTIAAAGGYITFSCIGYSSETMEYVLDFPQLRIGDVTYYYNAPSEPTELVGVWYVYPGKSPALIFFPGKRVKDENKRETPAKEGEFIWYSFYKGKYTISNRNIPDSSLLVVHTTHIHVSNIWSLVYADESVPLEIQELFDPSVLAIPSSYEGIREWWFTIAEVKKIFMAAADRTRDLVKKREVYALMEEFLDDYQFEGTYAYTVDFDPEAPFPGTDMTGVPNKLTLTQGEYVTRFCKYEKEWDEIWDDVWDE